MPVNTQIIMAMITTVANPPAVRLICTNTGLGTINYKTVGLSLINSYLKQETEIRILRSLIW